MDKELRPRAYVHLQPRSPEDRRAYLLRAIGSAKDDAARMRAEADKLDQRAVALQVQLDGLPPT